METTKLQYGEYYHIFNRGNNSEVLFKETRNYSYFLALYAKYIYPIADTLAYCLMSNHYHLIVRIKDECDILTFSELKLFEETIATKTLDRKPTPSSQFSHLFNTYSKTININFDRTGSLFEHPFKRRLIATELYLQRSIAYVHTNPIRSKLSKTLETYPWSSYNALLSDKPTKLDRELVMKVFGDKEYFMLYHGSFKGGVEEFK